MADAMRGFDRKSPRGPLNPVYESLAELLEARNGGQE